MLSQVVDMSDRAVCLLLLAWQSIYKIWKADQEHILLG